MTWLADDFDLCVDSSLIADSVVFSTGASKIGPHGFRVFSYRYAPALHSLLSNLECMKPSRSSIDLPRACKTCLRQNGIVVRVVRLIFSLTVACSEEMSRAMSTVAVDDGLNWNSGGPVQKPGDFMTDMQHADDGFGFAAGGDTGDGGCRK